MDAGTSCSPARAPPMAFRDGCPSRRAIRKIRSKSLWPDQARCRGMLKEAEAAHGIRHVALRYFNAAGGRSRRRIGGAAQPETHSSRWFCSLPWPPACGQDLRQRLSHAGWHCIRDLVHVSDLADAHLAALDWLAAGEPSDSFQSRQWRGFSVAEVVRPATGERPAGRHRDLRTIARRPSGPDQLFDEGQGAPRWSPNSRS